MTKILILEKDNIKEENVDNIDNIFKKCKFKKADGFNEIKQWNFNTKIIKLFGKIDSNNSESIDLIEFKNIFSLIELEKDVETIFKDADTNRDNELTIDEFIIFIAKNNDIFKKLDIVLQNKFELKLKNDKRTILFNNFPGSPLKINWRPSLSNLNNLNDIKKNMY